MATVKRKLIMNFTSEEAIHHNKISITGTGSVGMACAISILLKSGVNTAGNLSADTGSAKDPEQWEAIHEVVASGYKRLKTKGYTSWGVALSIANTTKYFEESSECAYSFYHK